MADPAVIESVRHYMTKLREAGVDSPFAMLFGSNATGRADAMSDIDVVVVSARFDSMTSRDWINILWRVAARTDARIEPIPCGVRQWEEDDGTPILEVARREGIRIEN